MPLIQFYRCVNIHLNVYTRAVARRPFLLSKDHSAEVLCMIRAILVIVETRNFGEPEDDDVMNLFFVFHRAPVLHDEYARLSSMN